MRSFFAKKNLTFQIFFSSPRLIGLLHLLKFFFGFCQCEIFAVDLQTQRGNFDQLPKHNLSSSICLSPTKKSLLCFFPKTNEPHSDMSPTLYNHFLKLRKNFGNFLLSILRHGNGHFPIFFPNFYENI